MKTEHAEFKVFKFDNFAAVASSTHLVRGYGFKHNGEVYFLSKEVMDNGIEGHMVYNVKGMALCFRTGRDRLQQRVIQGIDNAMSEMRGYQIDMAFENLKQKNPAEVQELYDFNIQQANKVKNNNKE